MNEEELKQLFKDIGGEKSVGGKYEQWRDAIAKDPQVKKQLYNDIGGEKAIGGKFEQWDTALFGDVKKKGSSQGSGTSSQTSSNGVPTGAEVKAPTMFDTQFSTAPKVAPPSVNAGQIDKNPKQVTQEKPNEFNPYDKNDARYYDWQRKHNVNKYVQPQDSDWLQYGMKAYDAQGNKTHTPMQTMADRKTWGDKIKSDEQHNDPFYVEHIGNVVGALSKGITDSGAGFLDDLNGGLHLAADVISGYTLAATGGKYDYYIDNTLGDAANAIRKGSPEAGFEVNHNNIAQEIAYQAGSFTGILAETALATELGIPKAQGFPVAMGVGGGLKDYSKLSQENISVPEKLKHSIETGTIDYYTGLAYHSLGLSSDKVAAMATENKLGQAGVRALSNVLGFPAINIAEQTAKGEKVTKEGLMQSVFTGLAFSAPNLAGNILGATFDAATKASPNTIKAVNAMKITPETAEQIQNRILENNKRIEEIKDDKSKQEELNQLEIANYSLSNILKINTGAKLISLNSNDVIKGINQNNTYTVEQKQQLVDKVNLVNSITDPTITKSNEISQQIQDNNTEIQNIQNNTRYTEDVKEIKIKELEDVNKKLKETIKGVLQQPKQDAIINGNPINILDDFIDRDVTYGGVEGTLKKTPDGFVVIDDEGKSTPIESGESGKSPQELGVNVLPELSTEALKNAAKDAEMTGETTYNGVKYFVSLANPELENTVGDNVFKINKDGSVTAQFAYKRDKKLAVINKFLADKELPKRESIIKDNENKKTEVTKQEESSASEPTITTDTDVVTETAPPKVEVKGSSSTDAEKTEAQKADEEKQVIKTAKPIIVIGDKEYTGKDHGEAIDKAREAGEDVPANDSPKYEKWRNDNGKFKAEVNGEPVILSRKQAKEYGFERSGELDKLKGKKETKKQIGFFSDNTLEGLIKKSEQADNDENGHFINDVGNHGYRFITYPNNIGLYQENYGIRTPTTYMVDYAIMDETEAKNLEKKYNAKYEKEPYGDNFNLRFKDKKEALKFIFDLTKKGEQDVIQEPTTEKKVPRTGEGGENIPQDSEGMGQKVKGKEVTKEGKKVTPEEITKNITFKDVKGGKEFKNKKQADTEWKNDTFSKEHNETFEEFLHRKHCL